MKIASKWGALILPVVLGAAIILAAVQWRSHRNGGDPARVVAGAPSAVTDPHGSDINRGNEEQPRIAWMKGGIDPPAVSDRPTDPAGRLIFSPDVYRILDPHLSAFVTDEELAAEYAALVLGTSTLYRDPELSAMLQVSEGEVMDCVFSKIRRHPPSSDTGVEVVFEAIKKYVEMRMEKGKLRVQCVWAFRDIAGRVEGSEKAIAAMIESNLQSRNVAGIIQSYGDRVDSSPEYEAALWAAYRTSGARHARLASGGTLCENFGWKPEVAEHFLACYSGYEESLRGTITRAIASGKLKSDKLYEFAVQTLPREPSIGVRYGLIDFLAQQAAPASDVTLAVVRQDLFSHWPVVELKCIGFLGAKGEQKDIASLDELLAHESDNEVRKAAERARSKLVSRFGSGK